MAKNPPISDEKIDDRVRDRVRAVLKGLSAKTLGRWFGTSLEGSAVFMATVLPRLGDNLDRHEAKALRESWDFLLDCMVNAIESMDSSRLRRVVDALDEAKRQFETGELGHPANPTLVLSAFYAGEQAKNGERAERRGLIEFLHKHGLRISERHATNILRDLGISGEPGRPKTAKKNRK